MTHSENQQVLQWVQSCLIRLDETRIHLIIGNEVRAGVCLKDAAIKMKEAIELWGLLHRTKDQLK